MRINPSKNQTDRSTANAVLARIEREGIVPLSRWRFMAREGVVWSLGVVSVCVGGLAFVGILFELDETWWEMYEATHESFIDFLLDALPLIWLVVFFLFLSCAYYLLRVTRRGYRYSLSAALACSLLCSVSLGGALYISGSGRFVDEQIGAYVPFHNPLIWREQALWMMPEEGRVAGIVRDVSFEEDDFWIEGVDGVTYTIKIDLSGLDRAHLRPGESVRVAGFPATTHGFLEGCVILMRHNDILRFLSPVPALGFVESGEDMAPEGRILLARSAECQRMDSYGRLIQHGV